MRMLPAYLFLPFAIITSFLSFEIAPKTPLLLKPINHRRRIKESTHYTYTQRTNKIKKGSKEKTFSKPKKESVLPFRETTWARTKKNPQVASLDREVHKKYKIGIIIVVSNVDPIAIPTELAPEVVSPPPCSFVVGGVKTLGPTVELCCPSCGLGDGP